MSGLEFTFGEYELAQRAAQLSLRGLDVIARVEPLADVLDGHLRDLGEGPLDQFERARSHRAHVPLAWLLDGAHGRMPRPQW